VEAKQENKKVTGGGTSSGGGELMKRWTGGFLRAPRLSIRETIVGKKSRGSAKITRGNVQEWLPSSQEVEANVTRNREEDEAGQRAG